MILQEYALPEELACGLIGLACRSSQQLFELNRIEILLEKELKVLFDVRIVKMKRKLFSVNKLPIQAGRWLVNEQHVSFVFESECWSEGVCDWSK